MKTTIYNKLVRDKIPQIIRDLGKEATTEILSDDEYREMLDLKLQEETAEYQKSKNIEELADIIEVVYAIAHARGISIKHLEKVRYDKEQRNGGFKGKVLLKEVRE